MGTREEAIITYLSEETISKLNGKNGNRKKYKG